MRQRALTSQVLVSSVDLRPSLMSVLRGMHDADLLAKVVTTLAFDPKAHWLRALQAPHGMRASLYRKLSNRVMPEFLSGKVDCIWWRECLRLLAGRALNPVAGHKVWLWSELNFDAHVARRYAGRHAILYGMEHSSLLSFEQQKRNGGACMLRQVTAHGRFAEAMLQRELRRFPEQAAHYAPIFRADFERSIARKEQEYALADRIIANSSYVAKSFIAQGISADKLCVVPTGFPAISARDFSKVKSGPCVFLFAGMLNFRKGIPDLLAAWKALAAQTEAELWIAGSGELANFIAEAGFANITLLGHVSPSELKQRMLAADVFVLPTLLEGLAHVTLEAAACGLPVITTESSGAGDSLRDGEHAFYVPEADPDALCARMRWCLDHRTQLPEIGARAQAAASAYSRVDANAKHLRLVQDFLAQVHS